VQCTAGTDENQIRYGWNYADLLAKGPSEAALVPTPLYRAMQDGKLCRLEELTRMGADVQDTLITVLSEKMMPIPSSTRRSMRARLQRHRDRQQSRQGRQRAVLGLKRALQRRGAAAARRHGAGDSHRRPSAWARWREASTCRRPRTSPTRSRAWSLSSASCAVAATLDGKITLEDAVRHALRPPRPSRSWSAGSARLRSSTAQAVGRGDRANMIGAIVKDPVQDKAVPRGIPRDGAEEAAGLRRVLSNADRSDLIRRVARWRPRSASSASRTTGRAPPRLLEALDAHAVPRAVLIEGPADASELLPGSPIAGDGAARSIAHLRGPTIRPRRVLAVRDVLSGISGGMLGRAPRRGAALHRSAASWRLARAAPSKAEPDTEPVRPPRIRRSAAPHRHGRASARA
jgi:hypothetical protein